MTEQNARLLIVGMLDFKKTEGILNSQIQALEKKVQRLKISVQLDDKTSKVLSDYSKAMENHKKISQELNQVKKEEKVVTKELDGTVKENIRQTLKSGEVITKEIKRINEKTRAIQDQTVALKQQGELQKNIISQKNGQSNNTQKYRDNFNDITYKPDGSTKIVQNVDQQKKMVESLTNSVRKLNKEGTITASSMSRMLSAVNGAKTEGELKRVEQVLNRIQDSSKTRKQTQAIEEQVERYKKMTELQVNKLRSDPRRIITPEQNAMLDTHLASVNALEPKYKKVKSQMSDLTLGYKQLEGQIQKTSKHTQTFGDMMSQAFTKFPINIQVGIKLF